MLRCSSPIRNGVHCCSENLKIEMCNWSTILTTLSPTSLGRKLVFGLAAMADPLGNLLQKIKQLLEDNELSLPEKYCLLHQAHTHIFDCIQQKINQAKKAADDKSSCLICDNGAALQFPQSERRRAGTFQPVR